MLDFKSAAWAGTIRSGIEMVITLTAYGRDETVGADLSGDAGHNFPFRHGLLAVSTHAESETL